MNRNTSEVVRDAVKEIAGAATMPINERDTRDDPIFATDNGELSPPVSEYQQSTNVLKRAYGDAVVNGATEAGWPSPADVESTWTDLDELEDPRIIDDEDAPPPVPASIFIPLSRHQQRWFGNLNERQRAYEATRAKALAQLDAEKRSITEQRNAAVTGILAGEHDYDALDGWHVDMTADTIILTPPVA